MSLLGEIGEALRDAFSGDVFPAAILHVATEFVDEYGVVSRAFADHTASGFVSKWKAEVLVARGWTHLTAKVVLVQNPSLPAPKIGDEVTAERPLIGEQQRYTIIDVSLDPADATWQVAGVPA